MNQVKTAEHSQAGADHTVEQHSTESVTGSALEWSKSPPEPILGESLRVNCPALREASSTVVILVEFEINEDSPAVQFLDPTLTASQNHPFLFTQCQAIHARSLCPCQVHTKIASW